MESLYEIEHPIIVTGVTASNVFLIADLNDKQIGVPLFTFSSTVPAFDFVQFQAADIDINNATTVLSALVSSYDAGIATYVGSSGFAWPIYRVDQDNSIRTPLNFKTATIVADLTARDLFVMVKVNGTPYGIPLYNYGSEYPFATATPMEDIPVKTVLTNDTLDIGIDPGSTNLNSKIRTYRNLIDRIKFQLGSPFVNIEVCEDVQIVDFIDMAMEYYTKYAGYTEEYLVFNSDIYFEPGLRLDKLFSLTVTMRNTMTTNASAAWDYDLADYRKVVGIFALEPGETTGINSLFTLEQAMSQQTYFSYMLGNVGFDLVTWEVLKGWLDTREKVLAQTLHIDFDNRNQLLRIIPPPTANNRFLGIVGCWVEKPIRDMIMERWIGQYALAITKIAIGNIRGKYQNIQLFGGGVINYNDLLSQGLEEKKALEEELLQGYGEVTPPRFWLG